MPRGVRKAPDYNAQLAAIETKLERYAGYVSALKAEKQELLKRKQEAEMKDLWTYMQTNKVTAADVLAQIAPAAASAASDAEYI